MDVLHTKTCRAYNHQLIKSAIIILLLFFTQLLPVIGSADSHRTKNNEQWRADFKPTKDEKSAGAAILDISDKIVVKEKDKTVSSRNIRLAILNEQAASDYKQISIQFNSFYDQVELLKARSIESNGTVHELSKDAIQIKTYSDGPVYDELRKLTFSLPAIKPGSFIEFSYKRTKIRSVIPEHWYRVIVLNHFQASGVMGRMDPVRNYRLTVDIPKNNYFKYKILNTKIRHAVTSDSHNKRYTWSKTNLPGIPQQIGMGDAQSHLPMIHLTSIPNWKTIDSWAYSVFMSAMAPTESIRKLSTEIVNDSMSQEQKIKAIFYYVQKNIRYIEADVTRGGIIPHTADQVLANRYGDCKDQAVLLGSLLTTQNIEARPSLISPYPQLQVHPKVPMPRFSHIIINAANGKKEQWLDTSGDAGTFPGIHWILSGQTSFIIDGKGGKLVKLQAKNTNSGHIDTSVDFSIKKDTLVGDLNIKMGGAFDQHYKLMGKNNPELGKHMRQLVNTLFSNGEIESFNISGNYNNDKPFQIHALVKIPYNQKKEEINTIPFSGDATQVAMFTNLMKLPDEKRIYPYQLGFPFELTYTVTAKAPDTDFKPIILRGNQATSTDNFILENKIITEKAAFKAISKLKLKSKVIPKNSYDVFRRDIRRALDDSRWTVLFHRDEHAKTQKSLEEAAARNQNDIKALLELAKHHLAVAEFDKALKVANSAIKLDPSNGEAHYSAGIALGFLEKYTESQEAITKSRDLGYRP